jgi:hypothetical protein
MLWGSLRLIENLENLPFTVTIVPKGVMEEFEFLWKTVGITNSYGAVNQGGEHSLLVCRMVVRGNIQIQVCVSGLCVYSMSQGAIRPPINIYILEGDVAICLSLHGELYVVRMLLRWRRKSFSFPHQWGQITEVLSMYLKQQRGLWVALLSVSSSESFIKKLAITGYRDLWPPCRSVHRTAH